MVGERLQVSVILTDACNMRCTYCTTAKRPVTIAPRHLDRLLELLARSEAPAIDLNFHGGEPLLAWDRVVQLAEGAAGLARERRVSFNLCTNGTALDAGRAAFLAARGFNVRLSIDGRREDHVLHRVPHGEGDASALHAATLAALDHLVAAGARTAANMVVTPATVGHLFENAVFLVRRGLVHLVVSPVVGMPWPEQALVEFDRQLARLPGLWTAWMLRTPRHRHEDLRRALLSEIDRATYCLGERMNQPDARVLVVGADGRVFGDEPDVRTERALVVGHLDTTRRLEDLPRPARTAFQLMYDRAFHPPHVLRDVRRTHRLLRRRVAACYRELFGASPPGGGRRAAT